jgi:hypothetical protein
MSASIPNLPAKPGAYWALPPKESKKADMREKAILSALPEAARDLHRVVIFTFIGFKLVIGFGFWMSL